MTDEVLTPTRHFAQSVKRYRTTRGWTQPQLAERCQRLGLDWDRSIIANVEAARRASVTVQELLTLAEVFEVPPVLLIFPVGLSQETEFLPGLVVSTWTGARWVFYGDDPAGAAPITLYAQHTEQAEHYTVALHDMLAEDDALEDSELRRRTEDAMQKLRTTRAEIRRHGLIPPELPNDLQHVDDRRYERLTRERIAELRTAARRRRQKPAGGSSGIDGGTRP
ncbi:helix-turn-helix transcriptional regulator [Phytohabitans sp. ZYX-F-186]|uniref:Helix-turn-helix transcriptional regulator n=1 Tax=Phytohabitans maris TaxID=3071409 RepID=A0ABU0ZUP9_9ACTN|nr:helix-turn-helix transcriptional regulator [Phytohabitans sp. ZYX-F-186]MDQ7910773.1 helix-turn-helix transcriptional regulator [Phytohabitans sp. ZYX-F-186]